MFLIDMFLTKNVYTECSQMFCITIDAMSLFLIALLNCSVQLHTTYFHLYLGQRHVVLDVFCAESANTLHIFIVLNSARVHVWRFLRPGFEWSFLTKVELSVSRNVLVTSACFDRKSKLL